ncbi:MAG: DUF4105 domain-containing protein [Deferribacteraceae bacterium]|jgi:hypothetical protein|nr:DUF4105 domain-containing protein [Deferribacteraceae bacterium]
MKHFIIIFLLFAVSASADTLSDAIELANQKRLSESQYWQVLLHYKSSALGKYRSLIDETRFFLAVDGEIDPQAELEATIRAILAPAGIPDTHAQCTFPARTAWLQGELPMLADMPKAACPNFDNVSSKIAPQKASVVFPSYNMSGPGSMFGHTMIRLEPAESTSLLGYAATYGAAAEGAGALAYLVKGLTGGFYGHYSVVPYYEKLNEYEAIDLRDVWEYELNLTPDEVWRMYLHIWEMSSFASDYYFLDENCAYNLLFFLEAARPGITLTDGFIFVIPIDTVRAITSNDMVSKVNFRPSYAKRMEAMADSIPGDAVTLARAVADGEISADSVQVSNFTAPQQIAVLDLASELIRYNFQGSTPEEISEYRRRSLSVLMTRSRYAEKNEYPIERTSQPESGHKSARVTAGMGYTDSSNFVEMSLRPSFHSFIDNPLGYLGESNIDALDLKLRYYEATGKFNLKELTLLDVAMLSDITSFFGAPSWRAQAGVEDRSLFADKTLMTGYLNASGGVTFMPVENSIVWLFGTGEAEMAGRYSSWIVGGIGVSGGVIYSTGTFGRFLAEGSYLIYSDRGEHHEGEVSASYAVYPAIDHAISAGIKYMKQSKVYKNELNLTYMYYF